MKKAVGDLQKTEEQVLQQLVEFYQRDSKRWEMLASIVNFRSDNVLNCQEIEFKGWFMKGADEEQKGVTFVEDESRANEASESFRDACHELHVTVPDLDGMNFKDDEHPMLEDPKCQLDGARVQVLVAGPGTLFAKS